MSDCHSTTSDGVEYRLVPGFGGAYQVGSDGSIWSRKRTPEWKRLRPQNNRSGHVYIYLAGGTHASNIYAVHRIVLLAFVGPCPPQMESRHLNGMPDDNRVSNLEWALRSVNTLDRHCHGWKWPRGEHTSKAKLVPSQVEEVSRCLKQGEPFTAIAKRLKIAKTTVQAIAEGRSWAHVTGGAIDERCRKRIGESHTASRLTEAKVREIRRLFSEGTRVSELAKAFGVNPGTISCVISRRTWKHVT